MTEGFLQEVAHLVMSLGLICQTDGLRGGRGLSGGRGLCGRQNSYRIKAQRYKRRCVLVEGLFYLLG